jgi:hypothetical protein
VLNDAKQTPFSEKRKMNFGPRIWMGRSRGQTGFANMATAKIDQVICPPERCADMGSDPPVTIGPMLPVKSRRSSRQR